jgi:hypothetical protein
MVLTLRRDSSSVLRHVLRLVFGAPRGRQARRSAAAEPHSGAAQRVAGSDAVTSHQDLRAGRRGRSAARETWAESCGPSEYISRHQPALATRSIILHEADGAGANKHRPPRAIPRPGPRPGQARENRLAEGPGRPPPRAPAPHSAGPSRRTAAPPPPSARSEIRLPSQAGCAPSTCAPQAPSGPRRLGGRRGLCRTVFARPSPAPAAWSGRQGRSGPGPIARRRRRRMGSDSRAAASWQGPGGRLGGPAPDFGGAGGGCGGCVGGRRAQPPACVQRGIRLPRVLSGDESLRMRLGARGYELRWMAPAMGTARDEKIVNAFCTCVMALFVVKSSSARLRLRRQERIRTDTYSQEVSKRLQVVSGDFGMSVLGVFVLM